MGFDFRMVSEPRDLHGYTPDDPDDPAYFRLSMSGMTVVYQAMIDSSVLDPEAPFPDLDVAWDLPGVSPERIQAIQDHLEMGVRLEPALSSTERTLLDEARVRAHDLVSTRSPVPGRVPAFKFGSNDGWLVTPEECTLIATAMDELVQSQGRLEQLAGQQGLDVDRLSTLITSWAGYNRVASGADGYSVS